MNTIIQWRKVKLKICTEEWSFVTQWWIFLILLRYFCRSFDCVIQKFNSHWLHQNSPPTWLNIGVLSFWYSPFLQYISRLRLFCLAYWRNCGSFIQLQNCSGLLGLFIIAKFRQNAEQWTYKALGCFYNWLGNDIFSRHWGHPILHLLGFQRLTLIWLSFQ